MKQHKWHKEIKAWADGAEIEILYTEGAGSASGWMIVDSHVDWDFKHCEYRIKPQPKEPQYLYVYSNPVNGFTLGYKPHPAENMYESKIIGKIKIEVEDDN